MVAIDARLAAPQNGPPMESKLAVLAEYASLSDGKLNVMGIFDSLNSTTFPAGLPIFYVVVSLEAGPAEFETEKQITLILHDADGNELLRTQQSATVPRPPRAGSRSTVNVMNAFAGIGFTKPGDYRFTAVVDAEIPLYVGQTEESNGGT